MNPRHPPFCICEDCAMYGWRGRGAELENLHDWRLHELLEAGYPVLTAEQIANSDADLHQALELVEHGCPFATAAEIVL